MNKTALLSIVLAILLLAGGAAYFLWPKPPAPIVSARPLSGTYISNRENELGWVVVDIKNEDDTVICVWNRVNLPPAGKTTQQQIIFRGQLVENKFQVSSLITSIPNPQKVYATGGRAGNNITLRLTLDGKVFFEGMYEPSDKASVLTQLTALKQKAEKRLDTRKEEVKALQSKPAYIEAARHKEIIMKGNIYSNDIKEFIANRPATEKTYLKNTDQISKYYEGLPAYAGNKVIRQQLILMMHSLATSSERLHDRQRDFVDNYSNTIVPFYNNLAKIQKECKDDAVTAPHTDNPANATSAVSPNDEKLCLLASQMKDKLFALTAPLQDTVNALDKIYREEVTKQVNIITKAEGAK